MVPNQSPVSLTRSVELTESKEIVVEKFKDASGKIVRQQSFTKDQLIATRSGVQKQASDQIVRLDEMIAMFTIEEVTQ